MLKIAIIAEGVTDQAVIEAVVKGALGEDECACTPVQPPAWRPSGQAGENPPPGGWTLVFQSLEGGDHRRALQFNDLVIVHIDTDVCEERGFDVARNEGGRTLEPDELWERAAARLRRALGEDFVRAHGDRVLFAIGVDSVECWFMPLLYPDQKVHRAHTVGCLPKANYALRAADREPLTRGEDKQHRAYQKLAREFERAKRLREVEGHNPSLKRFVEQLEGLRGR